MGQSQDGQVEMTHVLIFFSHCHHDGDYMYRIIQAFLVG